MHVISVYFLHVLNHCFHHHASRQCGSATSFMPCRPKLCQRLAAQLSHPPPTPFGSNHIWISDELLSEAFNSYLRVSHATRRYGSNVPGPLEARRRASKRRMGCAVAATSMGPPGGDFGALFGAGAAGNAVEGGWSWKAPGVQSSPTKTTTNFWNWGAKPSGPPAELEELLHMPSPKESAEQSRAAFERLLENTKGITTLGRSDVAVLTEFLGSAADEPAAKNLSRLVKWLPGYAVSDPGWKEITVLICDKIQLASINDEELIEVIRALPGVLDWESDISARQRLHETYAAFVETLEDVASSGKLAVQTIFEVVLRTKQDVKACSGLIAAMVTTTGNNNAQVLANNAVSTLLAIHDSSAEDYTRTVLLSHLAAALGRIPSSVIADVLRFATHAIVEHDCTILSDKPLRALAWLDCAASASLQADHMFVVCAEILKRLRFSQIAEHFASPRLTDANIARSLLQTWLPLHKFAITPGSRVESSNAANSSRGLKTAQYGIRVPDTTDLSAVATKFEQLRAKSPGKPWSALVKAFKRTGFAYDHVVDHILHISKVRHVPKRAFSIFVYMLKDSELAIPTKVYVSLVEHFLAIGEHHLAYRIFREVPSIALPDVPDLPLALLGVVRFDMFEMFLRQPDFLTMGQRTKDKLTITPALINVAHLTAHGVANLEKLRPSQAYRRVWAMYRWLQDRGAPLLPLISRAFVTAGIVRPIKEHIWIPDERLEYILSVVERVEGIEVRGEVEELARAMRRNVHDEVIAKRAADREFMWTKRTDTLVGKSRFRLKRWSQQKPVPVEGGKSFVVPSVPKPPTKNAFEAVPSEDEAPGEVEQYFEAAEMMYPEPISDLPEFGEAMSTPASEPVLWRPIQAAEPQTKHSDSSSDFSESGDVTSMPDNDPVPWRPVHTAESETREPSRDSPVSDDTVPPPAGKPILWRSVQTAEIENGHSEPPRDSPALDDKITTLPTSEPVLWRPALAVESATKHSEPTKDLPVLDDMISAPASESVLRRPEQAAETSDSGPPRNLTELEDLMFTHPKPTRTSPALDDMISTHSEPAPAKEISELDDMMSTYPEPAKDFPDMDDMLSMPASEPILWWPSQAAEVTYSEPTSDISELDKLMSTPASKTVLRRPSQAAGTRDSRPPCGFAELDDLLSTPPDTECRPTSETGTTETLLSNTATSTAAPSPSEADSKLQVVPADLAVEPVSRRKFSRRSRTKRRKKM